MRLKRSALTPCPQCKVVKWLDWKFDSGGGRFMDRWGIECVACSARSPLEYSTKEAIEKWNEWADKTTKDQLAKVEES